MSKEELCPLCDNLDRELEALNVDWIQCEICKQWYHLKCLKLSVTEANSMSQYHCIHNKCVDDYGPSVMRRISSRSTKRKIDYVAMDQGLAVSEIDHHPHISKFNQFTNEKELSELIHIVDLERDGIIIPGLGSKGKIVNDEVISQLITKTKLRKPILIPNANTYSNDPKVSRREEFYDFEFHFPRDLTISKISDILGEDRPVEVMDVLSQNNSTWSLGMWRDYYNQSESDRDRIRNVISLEVSGTELGNQIKIPSFVSDFDIVKNLFTLSTPKFNEILEKYHVNVPSISKYVLMSVKDSFTDFHVDFGGTSVYYTVLRGHKTFIMYPPTEENLKVYQKWCLSSSQNTTWLGDLIRHVKYNPGVSSTTEESSYMNNGIKIEIEPGDMLVLPSGWIHAVYTPVDSLVIGGNFLTMLNLPTHLTIYDIESVTRVPEKYKFPQFICMVWLIGFYYLTERDPDKLDFYERKSLIELLKFYQNQLVQLNDESNSNTKKDQNLKRTIKSNLPPVSMIGKPQEFVERFEKYLEKANFKIKQENDINDVDDRMRKRVKVA